ncbi:S8 family peptidase, partial [Halorussus sp. GCM10023401]
RAAATRAASDVVRTFDSLGVVTIRVPERALAGLRRNPHVRYVERNGTYRALGETTPWGVERIAADVANANDFDGEGSHVAILDTGIDGNHPDLQANVGAGVSLVDCGGVDCPNDWSDDSGHGTHCAGIAGATSNAEGTTGVSTRTTLHAVKVLDSEGYGTWSDIAAGIERVADEGWDVANLSFGGGGYSYVVAEACTYAAGKGVLLVGATGNAGPCTDCVEYPAKYDECLAVGATTKDDELADFSATGPEVELVAPGESVYSTTVDGYTRKKGTSMAAPHVSGVAATLMADGLTAAEARTRLRETATDLGLSSDEQGSGLLDAAAATGVGERGTLAFDQPDSGTWFDETLSRAYGDAVAVVGPLSFDGADPSHVRVCGLRDVDEGAFRYKIEEWDYLDGAHVDETAHYSVFEAGTVGRAEGSATASASGVTLEVGAVETDQRFARVDFAREFASAPVVVSQPQTRRGGEAVVTRNRNVSASGFEVALAEQGRGPHKHERIGYVALEPGVGALGGTTLEVGRTADAVDHGWHRIDFERSYDDPHFVADMQTYHGPDTAGLRYRNLTGSSVEVRVEEEESVDAETAHGTEVVGYAVSEGTGAF